MKYIAVDIETRNTKIYGAVIWIVAISRVVKGRIKSELFEDCNGLKNLPQRVKDEFSDPNICKIIHSVTFDKPILEFTIPGVRIVNVWCSATNETVILGTRYSTQKKQIEKDSYEFKMLCEYSSRLDYTLMRYKLGTADKEMRSAYIDREFGIPFTKQEKQYPINDTNKLHALQRAQTKLLVREQLMEVGLLENKTAEVLSDMLKRGIGCDPKLWAKIAKDNEAEFKKRGAKLPTTIKNWNSPAQVKEAFKNIGVYLPSYDVLDDTYLATRNKLLGDFILAREYHKAVTSYGMNWFDEGFIDPDNRVRPGVVQCINTGRMSMNTPNLQQLPGEGNSDLVHLKVMEELYRINRMEKRKWQHRSAFVPAPGHVFIIGDFSGQEIGVMASAANERLWIDAMLRGEDIHSLTASLIDPEAWRIATAKGCTFPRKCKCPQHVELRKPAKINNFMLAYGGGPEKLAATTGMDRRAAIMYCAAHKRVTPALTRYLQKCGIEAQDTGVAYSADPYRRRRVLLGDADWKIRNQGMNTPIQSAGANMLKLAMISIPQEFPIVLVIHDEIILEVKKSKANAACRMLKEVMEKSANYITGIAGLIKVEPRIAHNIMKE